MNRHEGILLVIDDEPRVLSSLGRLLDRTGLEFHGVSSCHQADRILDLRPVDIALVDHNLGPQDLTGLDYLAGLATRHPDCFRIIFTGAADVAFTVEAINRGAIDAFLLKPWDEQQLNALIRQGLETAWLRRANRSLVAELSERNAALERFNQELERSVDDRTRHLREAHRLLQDSQRELVRLETQGTVTQLVRGLAHELNNPLAVIMGYSQRLQRIRPDDADANKRLGVILDEVEHCRVLVEQLRSLAAPLDEDIVECRAEDALNQAAERAKGAGRPVPILVIRDGIPKVLAGQRSLIRVFEQILDNAAQAGSSTCWLSGDERLGRVRLRLDNDGVTPEDRAIAHATKPFFTTRAHHRGLGLAVATGLLLEQGGTIVLGRREEGPGASVTIHLPAITPSHGVINALAPARAHERVVLVVDDEPLVAELLHDCLSELECRCLTVGTIAAALDQIGNESLSAVLADVHLPDGHGADFLQRLLVIRPSMQGRIALITGDSQSQDIERLRRETHLPVLAKPFRLEQVNRLLGRLLAGSGGEAESSVIPVG